MFPHTSDLKLKYGAYCCDGLNFSEYNEKISSIVCNNCDCDKSKQPNVISFVTNSEDSEGNKICGASGENLLLYTNHVYQVLFCHHLGINDAECEMIEHERPNDLEQQKVAVLRVWLEEGERTWRDFIRALALMRQYVVAKILTKEHDVYFFNVDIALEMCNDLNED